MGRATENACPTDDRKASAARAEAEPPLSFVSTFPQSLEEFKTTPPTEKSRGRLLGFGNFKKIDECLSGVII